MEEAPKLKGKPPLLVVWQAVCRYAWLDASQRPSAMNSDARSIQELEEEDAWYLKAPQHGISSPTSQNLSKPSFLSGMCRILHIACKASEEAFDLAALQELLESWAEAVPSWLLVLTGLFKPKMPPGGRTDRGLR